jgi:hypothetical protein
VKSGNFANFPFFYEIASDLVPPVEPRSLWECWYGHNIFDNHRGRNYCGRLDSWRLGKEPLHYFPWQIIDTDLVEVRLPV